MSADNFNPKVDAYIENAIYGRNFRDDNQRIEHLFRMYALLLDPEAKNQLFEIRSA